MSNLSKRGIQRSSSILPVVYKRDVEFKYDYIWYGLWWMVAASLCSGFGNSLQPVSTLAFLHTFMLLTAFDSLIKGFGMSLLGHCLSFSSTVFIQALGTALGFSGIANPHSAENVIYVFLFGLLFWFLYTFLALYFHYAFMQKYPGSFLLPLIYPAAHTAVTMIIIGYALGVLTALGGSVLDYAPLRYVSALFGLGGVNFVTVLGGTLVYLLWVQHDTHRIVKTAYFNLGLLVVLFIITGFIIQGGWLYDESYSHQIRSTVPVSCLLSQRASVDSADYQALWHQTETRANAGDSIILWSEKAIQLNSAESERQAILRASDIAKSASNSGDYNRPYIGITYELTLDQGNSFTNQFVLVNPKGLVAWNYQKSYPLPVMESNVRPGGFVLPTSSGNNLGELGGAIGFDMDHPWFIRQASGKGVDILLQPSWTWGSVGPRSFDNEALRAIENGLTLFRCSSDGVSGIVSGGSSLGSLITAQVITDHSPNSTLLMQLPIVNRKITLYSACGFVFDWLMLSFSLLVSLAVIFDIKYISEIRPSLAPYISFVFNDQELVVYEDKKYEEAYDYERIQGERVDEENEISGELEDQQQQQQQQDRNTA